MTLRKELLIIISITIIFLFLIVYATSRIIRIDKLVPLEAPPTPSVPLTLSSTPTSQPLQTWVEPVTEMEFVWVPEGCFEMGCTPGIACRNDENPIHQVCLDGFWMGKYEVTQEQWQRIMGENPSHFNKDKVGQDTSNYPVEQVSWNDVQEFLRKLNEKTGKDNGNPPLPLPGGEFTHPSPLPGGETPHWPPSRGDYRLPSEAEWEYAARAGTKTMFYFGNEGEKLVKYAWYDDNSNDRTHPVGTLQPNAWGLYDMYGNVWEWCQDWYDRTYYSKSPLRNPQGPSSGEHRVLRGGSWYIYSWYCRSAFRLSCKPDVWYRDIGFRVVLGSVARTH